MKDRPERFAALLLLAVAALALAPGCNPLAGQTARLKGLKAPRWTVPGLGLEMVRIPPGTFLMGSPPDEPARRSDETQHQVTISRPFYVGVYEVTQGQYYKLMLPHFDLESWEYKRGPLHKGAAFCYRDYRGGIIFGANATGGKLCLNHPMESVTWDEAVAFCRKLTEIERNAGRLLHRLRPAEGRPDEGRLPVHPLGEPIRVRAGRSGHGHPGLSGGPRAGNRPRRGQRPIVPSH